MIDPDELWDTPENIVSKGGVDPKMMAELRRLLEREASQERETQTDEDAA